MITICFEIHAKIHSFERPLHIYFLHLCYRLIYCNVKSLDELQSNTFHPSTLSVCENLNHFLQFESVVIQHFLLRREIVDLQPKAQFPVNTKHQLSSQMTMSHGLVSPIRIYKNIPILLFGLCTTWKLTILPILMSSQFFRY